MSGKGTLPAPKVELVAGEDSAISAAAAVARTGLGLRTLCGAAAAQAWLDIILSALPLPLSVYIYTHAREVERGKRDSPGRQAGKRTRARSRAARAAARETNASARLPFLLGSACDVFGSAEKRRGRVGANGRKKKIVPPQQEKRGLRWNQKETWATPPTAEGALFTSYNEVNVGERVSRRAEKGDGGRRCGLFSASSSKSLKKSQWGRGSEEGSKRGLKPLSF